MGQTKDALLLSYLPTVDDFAAFRVAAVHASSSPLEGVACRLLGLLLILAGIVFWMLWGRDFVNIIADVFLVLLGLAIVFFHDVLQPTFVRRRAFSYFSSHQEQMVAQTVIFTNEKIKIQTDRYTASFDYIDLYKVYENKQVFILYTGIDEMRFIPKRVVSEEEKERMELFFDQRMKQKKQQEGAREWTR